MSFGGHHPTHYSLLGSKGPCEPAQRLVLPVGCRSSDLDPYAPLGSFRKLSPFLASASPHMLGPAQTPQGQAVLPGKEAWALRGAGAAPRMERESQMGEPRFLLKLGFLERTAGPRAPARGPVCAQAWARAASQNTGHSVTSSIRHATRDSFFTTSICHAIWGYTSTFKLMLLKFKLNCC